VFKVEGKTHIKSTIHNNFYNISDIDQGIYFVSESIVISACTEQMFIK